MKRFEFIAKQIVEAENEEEAKMKFANESWDFAASAECNEIEEIKSKVNNPVLCGYCSSEIPGGELQPELSMYDKRILYCSGKEVKMGCGKFSLAYYRKNGKVNLYPITKHLGDFKACVYTPHLGENKAEGLITGHTYTYIDSVGHNFKVILNIGDSILVNERVFHMGDSILVNERVFHSHFRIVEPEKTLIGIMSDTHYAIFIWDRRNTSCLTECVYNYVSQDTQFKLIGSHLENDLSHYAYNKDMAISGIIKVSDNLIFENL